MAQLSITPYLIFSGRCQEALDFYRSALGATIEYVMLFNQSPDAAPLAALQPGFENKVMHATFRVGGVRIMASDGSNDQSKFDGFRLALDVATEKEARDFFNGLANGGRVDMPLTKTFWSPCYGMVTDKFGLRWKVMVSGSST